MRDDYDFKGWETKKDNDNLTFTKGNIEINFQLWQSIYTVSTKNKNLAVPITREIHYIIDTVMTDFDWIRDFYLPPNTLQ